MRYMCMYKYSNYVYRNSLFLAHDCYLSYYAMDWALNQSTNISLLENWNMLIIDNNVTNFNRFSKDKQMPQVCPFFSTTFSSLWYADFHTTLQQHAALSTWIHTTCMINEKQTRQVHNEKHDHMCTHHTCAHITHVQVVSS